MPEIGEVARMVHYLRKHLVNRTIKTCQAFEDDIVYGKVGCSASAFKEAIEGKRVAGAGQQGKYFYLTFSSPPHAVMHLGMTGWIKFDAEETGYYKQAKWSTEKEPWPPKYMKFLLQCEAQKVDGEDREALEVAFVDPRRLARIRLVDCDAANIRDMTPLKENGPDPVIDKDKLTAEWLTALMRKKRVPIKALLLNQANISGVGNWVADEVLYQARIHPEQYSDTFADEQIKRLHDSLIEVCTIACETLADSTQFPEHWLMRHRWNKGKKEGNTLPNGAKITHLTVGGRTSAIVPSVQKKTAAVAGDVSDADEEDQSKPAKSSKRKAKDEDDEPEEPAKSTKTGREKKMKAEKSTADESAPTSTARNNRAQKVGLSAAQKQDAKAVKTESKPKKADIGEATAPSSGRSTRSQTAKRGVNTEPFVRPS